MVSWLLTSSIAYALTAVLSLLLITYILLLKVKILFDKNILILLTAYFIWLLVLLVISPNPSSILPYTFATPVVFLIIFTVPPIIYSQRLFLPWFLATAGALFTAFGIVFLFYGDTIGLNLTYTGRLTYFEYQYRIQSIFANSNNLGMFLMFGSLSAMYLVIRNKSWFSIALLSINFIGLLMSHGRNSLAAFVVGIIFMLLQKNKRTFSISLIILIIGFHAVVFSDIIDQELLAGLLSNRNYHIIAGVYHFIEYPLFGNQFGGADTVSSINQGDPGSHNTYLSLLTQAGIGGIFYICALIYLFIKISSFVKSEWQRFIFGSFAASVIIMTFETMTIGGLSVESLLLATFFGFVHYEIVSEY